MPKTSVRTTERMRMAPSSLAPCFLVRTERRFMSGHRERGVVGIDRCAADGRRRQDLDLLVPVLPLRGAVVGLAGNRIGPRPGAGLGEVGDDRAGCLREVLDPQVRAA